MSAFINFMYIGLPYLAIAVCLVGGVWRYRATGFKVSSLSSQFLNSDKLFFGSMLFHWGILVVFAGHLLALLFPDWVISLNSNPNNLVIYEMIGFAFGLSALIGLVWLFVRRLGNDRVQMVTSRMDIAVELLIIAQLALGCWIAYAYRWGSSWFAGDLTPYLWSIVKLDPSVDVVSGMPNVVAIHIIVAFVLLALIPFSRLMHFLVAPFSYIGRPYQQVVWNWDRKRIRDTATAWSEARPRNN